MHLPPTNTKKLSRNLCQIKERVGNRFVKTLVEAVFGNNRATDGSVCPTAGLVNVQRLFPGCHRVFLQEMGGISVQLGPAQPLKAQVLLLIQVGAA
jgi:hypothetical protein